MGDARVILHRADGTREQFEVPPAPGDPHAVAMEAWAGPSGDAVRDGVQITPSFADGVACMQVMEQWRAEPPTHGVRLGPAGTAAVGPATGSLGR